MTDSKDTNEQEDVQDRDIPAIANHSDYTRYGIFVFIAVGIIAIIAVATDGIKKSKKAPLTTPQQITFKHNMGQDKPFIKEPEPPINMNEDVTKNGNNAFQEELQRQAIKLARLEEQKRIARWQSPQLVFDESTDRVTFSGQPTDIAQNPDVQANMSMFSATDPNSEFASQLIQADVKTAQAGLLQHPDTLVTQGTMIDGILETAIQSDLPGMVRAIVSENVYSFDGSHLVIPRGSKLIGRYNSGVVRGQSRVFVIWTRLIRHDGVSINIASYGTDDLGRSGLSGQVYTHFFERFGSSVLLSMIDTGLKIGAQSLSDKNSATVALETGSDFSRSAEIALENSIAIKPTIHVSQGAQIKVFVGQDLSFSDVTGNKQR